jgi:hypothetical protein
MVMLPAQKKGYSPFVKLVSLAPAIVLVAVIIFLATVGWSQMHGSSHSIPSDEVLASGQLTGDQLLQRVEGALTYPKATNVRRASGSLESMASQNPLYAVMLPSIMTPAQDFAAMPLVFTTFASGDDKATVLSWYGSQLSELGWCAPSSVNTNADIQVYVRQRREAFVIVDLPSPPSAGGASVASQLLSYYAAFPSDNIVPAC